MAKAQKIKVRKFGIPCNDNLRVDIEKDRAIIRVFGGSRVFFQVIEAKCFVDCYYAFMADYNKKPLTL